MESWDQLLSRYHKNLLLQMAKTFAIQELPTRKGDIIRVLMREITARAASGELTQGLTEAQKALLGILLHHGGEMNYRQAIWRLTMLGFAAPAPALSPCLRAKGAVPPEDILQPLLLRGLITIPEIEWTGYKRTFTGFTRHTRDARPLSLGIPPEVLAALHRAQITFPDPGLGLERWLQPAPASAPRCDDAYTFLRAAYLLWESLRRQPARCTRDGRPTKHAIRRLLKQLETLGDESWLLETFQILKAADLIRIEEKRTVIPRQAERFWDQPEKDVLLAFFRRFRDTQSFYSEFVEVRQRTLSFDFSLQVPGRSSLSLRRSLLKALHQLPAGKWLHFETLYCILAQGWIGGFLFSAEIVEPPRAYGWWGSAALQHAHYEIKEAESETLRLFLGALRAMGMVQLHQTREQQWLLTACPLLHAAMEGKVEIPERSWQLVIQPNAQVTVMGEPPFNLLVALGTFAELETVQERTLTYHLTPRSVYYAFQHGWTPKRIRTFFERHSSAAMTQNLHRTLDEWWEQYQRILLRRDRLVIQARDTELIEALLRSPTIAKKSYRPRPDLLVLPAKSEPLVRRLLEKLDAPPLEGEDVEVERKHSLRLEGDRLVPTRPFPGLYVEAAVEPFAQRVEGGWRLTEASIREATRQGMTAETILETLREMLIHPLPAELEQQIKRWGGYYGTVQVVEVYLLRFASRKVLDEVLAEMPALRRRMRPLPTEREALALVQMKDWPKVKERLESLGVAFEMKRWW